ncbi:MAG: hypothetical protein DRR42_22630 [Gammaproteobacteria bacterium]|nr:MAG: hypothetical protein DRR42_22630 [Gammaproteobacteria bacterium]
MTTYSHEMTFDDSEIIMLSSALNLFIKHCDEQLKDGAVAPYWANRTAAEQVRRRLFSNPTQTSGYSLGDGVE